MTYSDVTLVLPHISKDYIFSLIATAEQVLGEWILETRIIFVVQTLQNIGVVGWKLENQCKHRIFERHLRGELEKQTHSPGREGLVGAGYFPGNISYRQN